jgi:hypothetical protein
VLLLCCYGSVISSITQSNNSTGNYISIQGTSNVNEFQLTLTNPDINEISEDTTTRSHYRKIKLAVNNFHSENQKIAADFREMVQASKFPYIGISIEHRKTADFEETSGMTNFNIIITIAGVSNQYEVPCEVFSQTNAGYTISGSFSINLTDFKIDPPRKFLGLIKVNNEVYIDFLFNFEEEILTEKVQF